MNSQPQDILNYMKNMNNKTSKCTIKRKKKTQKKENNDIQVSKMEIIILNNNSNVKNNRSDNSCFIIENWC